jgi:hypothetical protein
MRVVAEQPPGTGGSVTDFDELYAAHYGDLTVQLFACFGDR